MRSTRSRIRFARSLEEAPDVEATRVSLQELREICEHVLGGLIRELGDEVALHVDYYWSIPPNERYDVYRQPSELTVGQVVEDVENLRRLVQDDALVVPQALRWLGGLLEALGDELTP